MSLRNKITLFLIIISLVAVLTTSLLILQNAINDKKNYITELNSVLGPQITNSIDQKLKNLVLNLNELNNELTRTENIKSKAAALALQNFKNRVDGVDVVFIKTSGNKLLSFALNDSAETADHLSKSIETLANLDNAQLLLGKLNFLSGKLYLAAFNNKTFGAVILSEKFFKDSFELARGKASLLVTNKKDILYKSGLKDEFEVLVQNVPHDVWSRSELISLELKDAQDQNYLINFSRNNFLKDSFVILMAPQATWRDLTSPILKSSFSLIAMLILISILIAYSISKSLAQPIEELSKLTSQVGKGDWKKIQIVMGSSPEILKLTAAFNRMIENLKNREHDLQMAQSKIIHANSLAAVGRMGAGIAHEVKNPLSSIMGYSQLIEMKITGYKDPTEAQPLLEKIKDYVKLILDDTRRANKIISDLLTFSRQKVVETENVNLLNLINGFENKLKALCESQGVNFKIDQSIPENTFISVDPEQIYQVIFNLIQNAAHALNSENVPDKSIIFKVLISENFVEMTVTDNGPGISKENIKKIFEPFFSTKKVGEGTGLGLALCYGIIRQHQGSIDVISEPNIETSFKIRLPLID